MMLNKTLYIEKYLLYFSAVLEICVQNNLI